MRSRTTGPASGGVRSPLPIADAAPMGLLGLDSTGSCGYANAEWGRLAGGDPDRALGFGWLDAVDARDRDVVERAAGETLAAPAGTSRTVRFRLARPDGAVIPARAILRATGGEGATGPSGTSGTSGTAGIAATPGPAARRCVVSVAPDPDTMPPSILEALVEAVPCGIFVQSGVGRVDLVNGHAKAMLRAVARPGGWVGADATEMVEALAARMADPEAFRQGEQLMRDSGEATCELLTDSVDPGGEGEEFIRIIEHNATKLLHLVDDLLMLAMLGAPGNEPRKARTDLAGLVDVAAAHAEARARRSEIALAAHVGGSAWAEVDALRIEQVLDNLVGNAVKYSRAGDRVDVRLEPEGEPGFHRVQVADTGIGIPAEELSRVFDEFYRASTARTSGVPGTGLGLVIAQTIARKHGGSITLSSGAGQGTTATLRLPATA